MRSDIRIIAEISRELEHLTERGSLRSIDPALLGLGGTVQLRSRTVTDFTSWDYLDLLHNPTLRRAMHQSLERDGHGNANSRFHGGSPPLLIECEAQIARFFGTESAVLLSSRNQAVLSLVSALVDERDVVLVEEGSTSAVVDAVFLAQGTVVTVPFGDGDKVRSELNRHRLARRRFILCETVNPSSGTIAPLAQLSLAAAQGDASLLVDESYALGIVGARGAGGCELAHLADGVLAVFCDLSRGAAAFGGCIAAGAPLITHLMQRSPTFAQEIAPPPHLAAAVMRALSIVELSPVQRMRVSTAASKLATALRAGGCKVEHSPPSPICSIYISLAARAHQLCALLFDRGFHCEVVGSSAIRDRGAYLRAVVRVSHSEEQLTSFSETMIELLRRTATGK